MALPPPNIHLPFVQPRLRQGQRGANDWPDFVLTADAVKYLGGVSDGVDAAPSRIAHVRVAAASASIGATPIPIGIVSPGLWRLSAQVRVVTPGSVSSAIQVAFAWAQGGVTQSQSGANLVANTTTTREGLTVVARVDSAAPITYATVYASAGTAMVYELDIVAEALAIDVVGA